MKLIWNTMLAVALATLAGCDNREKDMKISSLENDVEQLKGELSSVTASFFSLSNEYVAATDKLNEQVKTLTAAADDKTTQLELTSTLYEELKLQHEELSAGFTQMSNQAMQVISHLKERNRLMSSTRPTSTRTADMQASKDDASFKTCDVCGGKGKTKHVSDCRHPILSTDGRIIGHRGCGRSGWDDKSKHKKCSCCNGRGFHVSWPTCKKCGGTGNMNSGASR